VYGIVTHFPDARFSTAIDEPTDFTNLSWIEQIAVATRMNESVLFQEYAIVIPPY
jgi:hypothetical protein